MHPFARLALSAATATGLFLAPGIASAKVRIAVDLDAQTIHVEAKDQVFDWKVSSGKPGYDTPTGTAGVLWMDKDHHSDEYDQAPMPNAIFFAPGYAIHGASTSKWGHKASHGCVRLPVAKSAILFDLVKAEGGAEITLTGSSPETIASVRAKQRENAAAVAQRDGASSPEYDAVPAYAGQGYAPPAGYDDEPGVAPRQGRASHSGELFGSVY